MDQKFVSFVVPTVSSPLATRAWEEENLLAILNSYKSEPKEGYYSMFSPAAQEIEQPEPGLGNFKGFRGRHKLSLDVLPLDFDSKDDTNLALANVRAFIAAYELSTSQYALFESGSKGYHLCVHTSLLGDLLAPHALLNERVKSFAQLLKQKYNTLDSGIYDIQRKFRIPFSIHPKTGKPKKLIEGSWPLALGSQHDGLSEMFMTAQIASGPTTTAEAEVLDRGSEEGPVLLAFKELKNKPCISGMLEHSFPSGDRNNALVRMVNDLMNSGHTAHQTREKLKSWCAKHGPDKAGEMDSMIARWVEGTGRYTHYCDDEIRKNFCAFEKCDHWGHLNPETATKIPTNEKTSPKSAEAKEKKTALFVIKKFAEKLLEQTPIVHSSDSNVFYQFDGEKYVEVKDILFQAMLEAAMPNLCDTRKAKELVATLSRKTTRPLESLEQDANRFINFRNGHYDKKTGTLEERTQGSRLSNRFFQYCLPFDYDPKALAPRFEQFLLEITSAPTRPQGDQHLAQIILEFMGYTLSGDEQWAQTALFMLGEGHNGKSKLIDVLTHMVGGEKNFSSMPLEMLAVAERLPALENKLGNLVSEENPDSFRKFSSQFKALCTSDSVTARRLRGDPYQMRSRAKMWVSTNNPPRTNDTSHGFFKRMLFIPFDARMLKPIEAAALRTEHGGALPPGFFDADTQIVPKLVSEAPGIFNLAWAAYQAARKRDEFTKAQTSSDMKDEFMADASPQQFILREHFTVIEGAKLTQAEVLKHFVMEAEAYGYRGPADARTVNQELLRVFGDQIRKVRHGKSNVFYNLARRTMTDSGLDVGTGGPGF